MTTPSRRRIDRILDPAYLDGIESAPVADLRRLIGECETEEVDLSQSRRWLHGMHDILTAELERRRSGAPPDDGDEDLVDRLSKVLAQPGPSSTRGARSRMPSGAATGGRRQIERLLDEAHLARLGDFDDAQLEALIDRLTGEERPISERRRLVQDIIDRLKSELVGRYKAGLASPSDVLRPGTG